MKNTTDFSLCFMRPEQQVLWVTVIHINLSLFLIMVKAFKMPQSIAFDHCISYTGAQWKVCYGFQPWKCMNSYANYSEPECTYQKKKKKLDYLLLQHFFHVKYHKTTYSIVQIPVTLWNWETLYKLLDFWNYLWKGHSKT